MALKSTVFKADVQLADIDHGCYSDLQLTLARHPSETDERMMVRLAALALNAHQVQDLCGGDARIGFGAGLSLGCRVLGGLVAALTTLQIGVLSGLVAYVIQVPILLMLREPPRASLTTAPLAARILRVGIIRDSA